jgi:hypothetical protein
VQQISVRLVVAAPLKVALARSPVYSRLIYNALHAPDYDERGISVERLKLFGRMAGLWEAHIIKTLSVCGVAFSDLVTYQVRHIQEVMLIFLQDFVRIYTAAFTEFDHWRLGKTKPSDKPEGGCCVIM